MGEMPVGILSPLASKILKACFLAGYVLAYKLHVRRKAGLNLPARKKPRPPEPKPLIETRSSNFNESRLSKSYKVRARSSTDRVFRVVHHESYKIIRLTRFQSGD
jgi:hypothetical protein